MRKAIPGTVQRPKHRQEAAIHAEHFVHDGELLFDAYAIKFFDCALKVQCICRDTCVQ